MAVEDHPLFGDWSAAHDKLATALLRFEAAKKSGHALLMKSAEARVKEAEKAYDDIVEKL